MERKDNNISNDAKMRRENILLDVNILCIVSSHTHRYVVACTLTGLC